VNGCSIILTRHYKVSGSLAFGWPLRQPELQQRANSNDERSAGLFLASGISGSPLAPSLDSPTSAQLTVHSNFTKASGCCLQYSSSAPLGYWKLPAGLLLECAAFIQCHPMDIAAEDNRDVCLPPVFASLSINPRRGMHKILRRNYASLTTRQISLYIACNTDVYTSMPRSSYCLRRAVT
jgi:hypothetical protein